MCERLVYGDIDVSVLQLQRNSLSDWEVVHRGLLTQKSMYKERSASSHRLGRTQVLSFCFMNGSDYIDYMTPSILKKLIKWIEDDTLVRFYQTKEWRKVRQIILNLNGGKCAKCHKKAHMVHHLKKVKEFPLLALLITNLDPLCNSCHNEEHPEKLAATRKRKFTNEERWQSPGRNQMAILLRKTRNGKG